MIAPSLYADLRSRGVLLSVAPTPKADDSPELPPLRLRVRAPEGALTPALDDAVRRHRDELLDFVFELEERAAIHLERDKATAAELEEAERFARACVVGGSAGPDGRLWLNDLAANHPAVRHMLSVFNAEVVEVARVGREEAA